MMKPRNMSLGGEPFTIQPGRAMPGRMIITWGHESLGHPKVVVLTRSEAITLARTLLESLEELDLQIEEGE